MGMLDNSMLLKLDELRRKLSGIDTNLANALAMAPEVWECSSVYELARAAAFDECEKQVLVDKDRGRHYLCAMSVDPERTRTRIDSTEFSPEDLVEDESPKSPMVLYFCEISRAEFRLWQAADEDRRREWYSKPPGV